MKDNRKKLGFTMIEAVVVLVVVAILSAIAAPSIVRFYMAGKQTNRDNIARTMYMAAQQQLSQIRITKGLDGEIANAGIRSGETVYEALGEPAGWLDEDNKDDVYYIQKGANDVWSEQRDTLLWRLLDPAILDKTILDDAILIEFNVRTGVVLSVFYGDAGQTNFHYNGTATDDDENNIVGGRGMNGGYTKNRDRLQGYYGVETTGRLSDKFGEVEVNLYDSNDVPLPKEPANRNALYAEFLIPKDKSSIEYTISISGYPVTESFTPDFIMATDPESALSGPAPYLYSYSTTDPLNEKEYICVVWILDYVTGDTTGDYEYSIAKYSPFDPEENITVMIEGDLTNPMTSNERNPYYYSESESDYSSIGFEFKIFSARHLYNIRYASGRDFTLRDDIDLEEHKITNFKPIPGFSGTLDGKNRTISNLKVGVSGNAGLFGEIIAGGVTGGVVRDIVIVNPDINGDCAGAVSGEIAAGGGVNNIVIENPEINGDYAGGYAGAVSGKLSGTIENVYVKYDKDGRTIAGAYAGGITGEMSGGEIKNVTFISPLAKVHISGGVAGGIVGDMKDGLIEKTFFLALAPKYGVGIFPIVCLGSIPDDSDNYYLRGKPVRPEEDDLLLLGREGYNKETADFGDGRSTWELHELYETDISGFSGWSGWTRKPGLTAKEHVLWSNDNVDYKPIYPYPYLSAQASALPVDPDWPIAEEDDEAEAKLFYCELYGQSGVPGYSYYPFDDTSELSATGVVHYDGYGLYIENVAEEDAEYTLSLDGTEYVLTVNAADKTVTVDGNPSWPFLFDTITDIQTGETINVVRIFIPNAVLEGVSDGEMIALSLSGKTLAYDASFNPMFAPRYGIRSPRHIDNIDSSAANLKRDDYTQQLDVDFALYRKRAAAGGTTLSVAGGAMTFNEAVVKDTFEGTYDGGGKEIRNLTVNAGADGNDVGLFAVNGKSIKNVVLVGAYITGGENVGGIAGRNASGGTITGSNVTLATIDGSSNVGGIAGLNAGGITYSYIARQIGNPSTTAYNHVGGDSNVGGIAGANTGTINICYADFTRVGTDDYSTNVGGIVGEMTGGTVSNVFYNYGIEPAQKHPYAVTIHGVDASTGGLAGNMSGGTLSNSYSDAYFGGGLKSNLLIGTRTGATTIVTNILGLSQSGYNGEGTITTGGTRITAANLRAAAAVTTLGGSWARRGTAATDINGYTYPYLTGLPAPGAAAGSPLAWWPLPDTSFMVMYYYELYKYPNPYNSGKWYGLWSVGGVEDTLDYSDGQVILEDGYVLMGVNYSPNNMGVGISAVNANVDTRVMLTSSHLPGVTDLSILEIPAGQAFVLPINVLEGFSSKTDAARGGLYPVEVWITTSGNGGNTLERGMFVNPLFAKAMFGTREEANAFDPLTQGYVIRTPRQLNNIGRDARTLTGNYRQEMNIDFDGLNTNSGYWKNDNTKSTAVSGLSGGIYSYSRTTAGRETINITITSSVVYNTTAFTGNGIFTGTYDGQKKAVRNIGNTSNTSGMVTAGGGIFHTVGAGGVIENLTLLNNRIQGAAGPVGGLTGTNSGAIRYVTVDGGSVTATAANGTAGGIAGVNGGTIMECNVLYATVKGGTGGTGGFAGANEGVIKDVAFLSTAAPDSPPVSGASGAVGGIVGNNNGGGEITRALYLAPAPEAGPEENKVLYPIAGTGAGERVTDCFFLYGKQYTLEGEKGELAKWNEGDYSIIVDAGLNRTAGGGMGLYGSYITIEFLQLISGLQNKEVPGDPTIEMDKWDNSTLGYPYPALKSKSLSVPARWPETDGPVRLDQEDHDDWGFTEDVNKVATIGFINGEFDMKLRDPDNPNEATRYYDLLNPNYTGTVTGDNNTQQNNSGWNFNAPSWLGQSNNTQWGYFWIYHDQSWIQGWNTRPVDQSDYIKIWNAIEFQRPRANGHEGRTLTDYTGRLTGVYAELNADVSSTLYQVLNTVPGTETYYSFYHSARGANDTSVGGGNVTDPMSFYLSGVDNDGKYTGGTATIIRPCITPRGNGLGSQTTRNTVVYGALSGTGRNTVTPAKVNFWDPSMNGGKGGIRNAYLIDLWIGGTGANAYGITFWIDNLPATPGTYNLSTDAAGNVNANIGLERRGYATVGDIPNNVGGVNYRAAAQSNVVGYWHVSSGANQPSGSAFTAGQYSSWKQYYGKYTIPAGQIRTEFAYESNRSDPEHGNYLAGVTFQAPSFLTVDKKVYLPGTAQEAKFVQPEQLLTVEITVKNWGETTAGNITIEDQLAPFDAYISYVGNVTGGTLAAGSTDQLVRISVANLAAGESRTVTFDIKVNKNVKGADGLDTLVSTLHYYFRNQAVAKFVDAAFGRNTEGRVYTGNIAPYNTVTKQNASDKEAVKVYIDPVELVKEITVSDRTDLKDGPFDVTLTVRDKTAGDNFKATGIVTVIIPKGFKVEDLSDGLEENKTADGYIQLTAKADFPAPGKERVFTYTLVYDGDGYGVSVDSMSAVYRYVFIETGTGGLSGLFTARLDFPRALVGVSIKDNIAAPMSFSVDTSELTRNNPVEPGYMRFDLFGDMLESLRMASGGYSVDPKVFLYKDGNLDEKAALNGSGNYELNIRGHIIELKQDTDGTCELIVTPKYSTQTAGTSSSMIYDYLDDFGIEVWYGIELVAEGPGSSDVSFDLSSEAAYIMIDIEAGVSVMALSMAPAPPSALSFAATEEDAGEPDDLDEPDGLDDLDEGAEGLEGSPLDMALIIGMPLIYIGRREKVKGRRARRAKR